MTVYTYIHVGVSIGGAEEAGEAVSRRSPGHVGGA